MILAMSASIEIGGMSVSYVGLAAIIAVFLWIFVSEYRGRGKKISKLEMDLQKHKELDGKYNMLLCAYLVARKKNEIDVIEEFEKTVIYDYKQLGTKSIPPAEYIASAMADFYLHSTNYISVSKFDLRKEIEASKIIIYSFEEALGALFDAHPELKSEWKTINTDKIFSSLDFSFLKLLKMERSSLNKERENLHSKIAMLWNKVDDRGKIIERLNKEIEQLHREINSLYQEYEEYKKRWHLLHNSVLEYKKEFSSNLTAIPYMSKIFADAQTLHLDKLAWQLDWGNNQERQKKVASLNALKKQAKEEIERIKIAEYQLAYLLELYPALQDVIDPEYSELNLSFDDVSDCDPARHYMEREEWEKLSSGERNQLALDRYIESRRKSKWQIGRDYELYCGYVYEKKGWSVDYFGSYNGFEDLGRDLILTKDGNVKIVQCKYWSHTKQIHENHIMQLYGSVIEYNLENKRKATGTLVTNTTLSEKAKVFARVLGIEYKENYALGDFPRIKCNIGRGERGEKTKIYHLPFDQQYDSAKVEREGEFMAMTVAEAEKAGFRRAYKWHGEE